MQPRKQKYRKHFQPKVGSIALRRMDLAFGNFGLKALEGGLIKAAQIEAARRAIVHHTKRTGRIWIRIFPDRAVTKKSSEAGMGGGKGDVAYFATPVKPGTVLFELGAVPEKTALRALRLAQAKLPIKTKIIKKEER